jgi:hypothetical protein
MLYIQGSSARATPSSDGHRLRPPLLLSIHLPPVADLDDLYDSSFVVDRIHDAVISLTDAVPFLPGQLFTTGRTWAVSQSMDSVDEATQVFFRNATQLALR